MAVTLELNSGAIAADLDLNAAASAGLRMESWSQAVASPVYGGQPGPVKETMTLMVERTSHNLLAASIQALDEYRVQADAYMRDRTTADPVWLECKMDDETGTRRSMVRKIEESYRLPLYSELCGPNQDTTRIKLELWRMPYWEDTAITAATAAAPSAAASVVYDYTAAGGDIAGDVPARIADSYIGPIGDGDILDRVWAGIRSVNKHGTLANFINVWECEDGANDTDAADVVDGTASGGDKVTVTPGTATWAGRMHIRLSQVTANYDDNLGLFLWLLRAQVSAGTWEIQLRFGYFGMPDDKYVRGPIVELTNTNWDFLEMGQAAIPMHNIHALGFGFLDEDTAETWNIQVWARRTGGAGTLDIDCLCPIPLDESWMTIEDGNISHTAVALVYGRIGFGQSPEGQFQAASYNIYDATGVVSITEVPPVSTDSTKFSLPLGDGRAYVTYSKADQSILTDVIYMQYQHYDCWLSLRGAE